jgi:hypothetical protein
VLNSVLSGSLTVSQDVIAVVCCVGVIVAILNFLETWLLMSVE